jgi:hypothetical protein
MTEAEERLAATMREVAAMNYNGWRRWIRCGASAVLSVALIAAIDAIWMPENGPTFMAAAVFIARLIAGWRGGWIAAALGFAYGELALSLPPGMEWNVGFLTAVVAPAAVPQTPIILFPPGSRLHAKRRAKSSGGVLDRSSVERRVSQHIVDVSHDLGLCALVLLRRHIPPHHQARLLKRAPQNFHIGRG